MDRQVVDILHSLSARIDRLEKKGLGVKLGMQDEAEFHKKMSDITLEYYKEEFHGGDEAIFDNIFKRKYDGNFTSYTDDFLPAVLAFVEDEAAKRIIGQLINRRDNKRE